MVHGNATPAQGGPKDRQHGLPELHAFQGRGGSHVDGHLHLAELSGGFDEVVDDVLIVWGELEHVLLQAVEVSVERKGAPIAALEAHEAVVDVDGGCGVEQSQLLPELVGEALGAGAAEVAHAGIEGVIAAPPGSA
ncbi:MAG: hypothetical protein BWY25_02251 [Chloroflexi bacterium ADurb.Bin222]|nr:MAG: hypothetical protein BWY25_02251 [Chloroflexi bacterium ADurb.Bin222]